MHESLEAAIQRVGSPVEVLRNAQARPHTFPVPAEFTNWRSEQRAWRERCVLFDQSHHMTDLFVRGPDALRLLSDFGVNTFVNFVPGKAKQYVAVNHQGHFIGDAIVFCLGEDSYDVVGHPTVPNWLQYNIEVGDYDVEVLRDDNSLVRATGSPELYRYELQGPTARPLVEKLTGAPLPEVKFFHMADFTIAGTHVRALRHGMAGQPGFELFGPWTEGGSVLEAILDAGEEFGLVRAGAKAYSTANLESAWIPSPTAAIFTSELQGYREWLPVAAGGSLGGSMDSPDIADYYLTPFDLGYGRTVRFDHDFLGRDALEAIADEPAQQKVTLVWDPADVAGVFQSQFTPGVPGKFVDLPKARYAFFHVDKVLRGDRQVGMSMDAGLIVNEQAFVSLATVDREIAQPGTEVTVLWGEEPNSSKPAVEPHRQVPIAATVAPAPFARTARETYRSS
jgi:vanillate/3-O-methylgallate O-demethylase